MSIDAQIKPVILIVEDRQDACKTYRDHLGAEAILIFAHTIPAAYETFLMQQPELTLVIMDGCVPGRDYNTGVLVSDMRHAGYGGPIIAGSPDYQDRQIEEGCLPGGPTKFSAAIAAQKLLGLAPPTMGFLRDLYRPASSEMALGSAHVQNHSH